MTVKMVDISKKREVLRIAIAEGEIKLRPETIKRIKEGKIEKGDIISVSQIAGILGVKKTPELLPMCHPIPITNVDVKVILDEEKNVVKVQCIVKTIAKTGCEMDALVGCAIALLNIWDMVKKYEKDEKGQYPYTLIQNIRVIKKEKKEISLH